MIQVACRDYKCQNIPLEVHTLNFNYLVILLAHLYYASTRDFIKSEKWAELAFHFQERCKKEQSY